MVCPGRMAQLYLRTKPSGVARAYCLGPDCRAGVLSLEATACASAFGSGLGVQHEAASANARRRTAEGRFLPGLCHWRPARLAFGIGAGTWVSFGRCVGDPVLGGVGAAGSLGFSFG